VKILKIEKVDQNISNKKEVAKMLIKFRNYLASLKDRKDNMTDEEALEEIEYYLDKGYPIYAARENKRFAGYFILKYDDDAVWLEHFYVKEKYRNQGIGSRLFQKAEEVVNKLGYVNLYNWVHPNNNRMINFLQKQGYDVLNMIEIRKKFDNEDLKSEIKVRNNKFKYNKD
jgi:GNAT superfamily N-acetyltransferase